MRRSRNLLMAREKGRIMHRPAGPRTWVLWVPLIATVAFAWPLPLRLASHLAGPPGDNYIFYWNLWWFRQSLWREFLWPLHTAYVFYPEGADLAFHTTTLLNTLPGSLLGLVIPLPVVFNLAVLGQFAFAWWAMFGCARRVLESSSSAERGAAAASSLPSFAATAYAFAPVHMAHVGHLNILSTGVLPLVVSALLRAGQGFTVRRAAGLGASLGLCALADGYFLLMGMLLAGLAGLYRLRRLRWRARVHIARAMWKAILAGTIAFLIVAAPVIVPVVLLGSRGAAAVHIGGAEEYVADALAYVLPSPFHPVWGHALQHVYAGLTGNLAESVVFPTFTVWFLALTALRTAPRESRRWWALALVFLVLSLGPSLHVGGHVLRLPLPKLVLDRIPWVWGARAASRFAIAAQLALALAAGLGLQAAVRRMNDMNDAKTARGRGRRRGVVGLAIAGFAFECIAWPFPVTRIEIPAPYALVGALGTAPELTTLLEIPPVHAGDRVYQLYQTVHGQPLLGGRLARVPRDPYGRLNRDPFIHRTMSNTLWGSCEDSLSLDGLDSLRVRYVALHLQFPPTAGIRRALEKAYEPLGPASDGVEILRRRVRPPSD